MKKTKSLKDRIIHIYLSTTILVACITSSYIYLKTHNYTQDTLEANYRSSADLMLGDMNSEIDSYCSYSYILSRNPSLINMLLNPYDIYDVVVALNSDIEPTIQFILGSSDAIENITIFTDESDGEIPSNFFSDVHTIQDTDWYHRGKKLDGTILMHEDDNVFIISPIRNYHSQKIDTGFVKVELDIKTFASEMLNSHENIFFTLNDEDGNQLFTTLPNEASNNYIPLTKGNLYGDSITATFYIHESFLRIPFWEMFLPIIAVLVVFILFSYAFMHLINKIMFLRLEKIMEQIEHIDANNFSINIEEQQNDEIGKLADCLNNMSIKIDNLFQELSKTKDREHRNELEMLRARIDPHFLYNIMDTINWIAIDGDTKLIRKITHELSVYYRTNLNYGKTMTTLYNEIENAKAYLNLQTIATSNLFDVEYKIDEHLLNYETCDFILQPLVENAITHGIKPLKNRRGLITVSLYEREESIHLVISDNGVGLNKTYSANLKFKKTHYGIKNIDQRIKLTFGTEYGVFLSNGIDEIGTIATIVIPKHIQATP